VLGHFMLGQLRPSHLGLRLRQAGPGWLMLSRFVRGWRVLGEPVCGRLVLNRPIPGDLGWVQAYEESGRPRNA
jgi:hypothetical protein